MSEELAKVLYEIESDEWEARGFVCPPWGERSRDSAASRMALRMVQAVADYLGANKLERDSVRGLVEAVRATLDFLDKSPVVNGRYGERTKYDLVELAEFGQAALRAVGEDVRGD